MPRKAKDKEELIEKEDKKINKKASTTKAKAASKTKTTTKKASTAKAKTTTKKSSTTKAKTTTTKKTSTTKAKTDTAKKSTAKAKVATTKKASTTKAKATTKKTGTTKAKTTTAKKTSTTKATKKTSKKLEEKILEPIEYYDLPYRYNETIVKVLAQTPNILFVYWDISDNDKQNFINTYGEFFFNDTKPVLIVYNDTMHYSFEVDINDYANSWYLKVNDSNCDYRVELGRRPINEYARIDNYLYISQSNEMGSPNDRILFDSLNNNVYFKNVKTNNVYSKDISLFLLTIIGKLYNVKDFYKTMYKDENIDFERLNLKNMPSS